MGRSDYALRFGLLVWLLAWPVARVPLAAAEKGGIETADKLNWLEDYGEAVRQAQADHKLLLILFDDPQNQRTTAAITQRLASDPQLAEPLDSFILLKLPADAKISTAGKE